MSSPKSTKIKCDCGHFLQDHPQRGSCEKCACTWYHPNTDHRRSIKNGTIDLQTIINQRDKYKQAIKDCLSFANGREYEWGERAINAFYFLEKALEE